MMTSHADSGPACAASQGQLLPPPTAGTPIARRLRLLQALGIAGVSAGVLGQAISPLAGPLIPAAMTEGHLLRIPLGWIPLAALLLTAAWGFLLTGALHAPRPVRWAVMAAWATTTLPAGGVGPLGWIGFGLGLILLGWRRWARPLQDFGLWEYGIFSVVTLLTFAGSAGWAWGSSLATLNAMPALLFVLSLSDHLLRSGLLAFPLLVLAGTDLAAMAVKGGAWLAQRVRPRSRHLLARWLLALSLAKLAYLFFEGVQGYRPGFWLAAAAPILLGYLARRWPLLRRAADPPTGLIVALVALMVPAVMLAPPVAGAGLVGGLGLTALAAGRRLLDKRWPQTYPALALMVLWMAWLLLGRAAPAWGPSLWGVELAGGVTGVAMAIAALKSPERAGKRLTTPRLTLALEALLVLTAMTAIHGAYRDGTFDIADLYATGQAALALGAAWWLWLAALPPVRRRAAWTLTLGGAALLACLLSLAGGVPFDHVKLLLMATAIIHDIVVAHLALARLPHSQAVAGIHRLCLSVGFSLLLVAIVGWHRVMVPRPPVLAELDPLPVFGLSALGLPLYALSLLRRLDSSPGLPPQAE